MSRQLLKREVCGYLCLLVVSVDVVDVVDDGELVVAVELVDVID